MKLVFLKGSKLATKEMGRAATDYLTRLKAFYPVEEVLLKSPDKPLSEQDLVKALDRIGDRGSLHVVLFDATGDALSTEKLTAKLRQLTDNPQIKRLVLVIGSPFGFSPTAAHLANETWSLASGTYPGDLAWVMALEQTYRATTIIRGVPYHHG